MPSASALEQIRRLIAAEVGKRQKPQQWLLDLRDRLLGLKVIWVEHGSEDDAYIIFETLNSRGKDLEVVDLLKNLLLNRLRGTRNARADTVRLKWDKMRDQLEASDGRDRINANSFILHWWQSRADYVAQRAVFADQEGDQVEVSGAGLPRAADEGWAALPCRCGARVLQLAAGGDRRARKPAGSRTLRRRPACSAFTLLVRARSTTPKLNAGQFNKTLQSIERYHFQHTVVSQLSSSGGVSQMYAKAARELYSAGSDQQARADVLKDIREKLEKRRPDRDQFILAFEERFLFTNDYTRDKSLCSIA